MIKTIEKPHRKDKQGFTWTVNKQLTTWYPNGAINKLILESPWGAKTFVRYDQAGNPIGGELSLA